MVFYRTDEGSLSNPLIPAGKVRKYSMSRCVFPPLKEAEDKPYLLNAETFMRSSWMHVCLQLM